MALQHKLCLSCLGIPKLHPPIFGSACYPLSVRTAAYAEDVVFMTYEGGGAVCLATFFFCPIFLDCFCGSGEVPEFKRFVERAEIRDLPSGAKETSRWNLCAI